MPIKFTLSDDLKKTLDTATVQGLIPSVKKSFSRTGPIRIKKSIMQDITQGISPVQGKGKFKRYSDSYKEVIRGNKTFRRVNGKLKVFNGKDEAFFAKSSPTKQVSPVNLRHSGGLHKSFKARTLGGFLNGFRLELRFDSFLAEIHNKLGAGKSKVIRRLLPTEKNETFNRKITTDIFEEVKKAVDSVVKEFNRK